MLTSVIGLLRTRLPKLALPVLAVILLSLTGHPSPARTPAPLAFQGAPGQMTEVVAPAATVVETVHYQARFVLSCGGSSCSSQFPGPGGRRRLNLTRMTCVLAGSSGSTVSWGFIELDLGAVSQYLPVDHSASNGVHTLNRAIDMQVGSRQLINIDFFMASGTVSQAVCTATGTRDTLQ